MEINKILYVKSTRRFGEGLCRTTLFFGEMMVDQNIDTTKGWSLIREAHRIAMGNKEQLWAGKFISYMEDYLLKSQEQ